MKRSSYRERDSAFGQAMLTLRTNIGLTQAELADRLGISRRAVAEWEVGSSYPKAEHLKQLIALGMQWQTFKGHEAQEIRALWKAAHQKVLLDEQWLHTLLDAQHSQLAFVASLPDEQTRALDLPRPAQGPRVDWGNALVVPNFYGRERELALLSDWVLQERCRVVSVLGMGGIGKSALAISLMHQTTPHFQVVLWRSLRDAPTCDALLGDCLQSLAPQPLTDMPASLKHRMGLLLEYLREARTLLVFDNLETLLEEGERAGHMRTGYEDYARLLRQVAQMDHQSCLLLTSREKPHELMPLEGSRTPVRSLRLTGLDTIASEQLLMEKDVTGTTTEQMQLIKAYMGNPLALKIVAQTIVEIFGSEIAPFLEQGEVIFGSIREVLDEQFSRLSAREQTVLLWLAILREPVTIKGLLAVLGMPLPRMQVIEAVEMLRRRSLVEQGKLSGSFTLQSVVLEYVTTRLISEANNEIKQGRLVRLIEHGLELANTREDIRRTRQRLIRAPLLALMRRIYRGRDEVEQRLLFLLDQLREQADYAQGYGPANLLALLHLQRGHLRGLDLSQLSIRGMYLQGVQMQDTNFSGATLQETIWTSAFDVTWAVTISPDGVYWAVGSKRGEVRVWKDAGRTLHLAWQAHTDTVKDLTFSPDGHTLATSSWDGAIKLWNLEGGVLLWRAWQTYNIYCLVFNPAGHILASGGDDATVRLWDAHTGTNLQTLMGHNGPVFALAWSPDGSLLASGGFDTQIRLWEMQGDQSDTSVRVLVEHTGWVYTLAFAPDGRTLASGSTDQTVKLWEVENNHVRQTLTRHTGWVMQVAWSPDGGTLASCGLDQTIWLWDVERGSYQTVLNEHTAGVYGIAFTPDGHSLLSGSLDGTIRVWEVERGQCVQIMQGYSASLYDIAWSPDGTQLAGAGSDFLVTIWDVADRTPHRLLQGHSWAVFGLTWSPDGQWLASSGWDNAVRVWDMTTDACVQIFRDPDYIDNNFQGIAWSPDGRWLANGSYQQGLQAWDVVAHSRLWVGHEQPTKILRVVWSPNGTRIASCGDDGSVCLWNASDGKLLTKLQKHRGVAAGVAWSPDGTRLASCGGGRGKGELFVWEVQSGEFLYTLNEPSAMINALAWGSTESILVSGGSDGMLRWWDLQHGECVKVRKGHEGTVQSLKRSPDGRRLASCGGDGAIQVWDLASGEHVKTLRRDRPYERLNITGIKGLTEAQKSTLRALGAVEEHNNRGF
jgi:WD40 repeat protein/transcriptional regulator with XRE-family HTH domain